MIFTMEETNSHNIEDLPFNQPSMNPYFFYQGFLHITEHSDSDHYLSMNTFKKQLQELSDFIPHLKITLIQS